MDASLNAYLIADAISRKSQYLEMLFSIASLKFPVDIGIGNAGHAFQCFIYGVGNLWGISEVTLMNAYLL